MHVRVGHDARERIDGIDGRWGVEHRMQVAPSIRSLADAHPRVGAHVGEETVARIEPERTVAEACFGEQREQLRGVALSRRPMMVQVDLHRRVRAQRDRRRRLEQRSEPRLEGVAAGGDLHR